MTLPPDLSAALATVPAVRDRAGARRRRRGCAARVAIDTGLAGVHDAGTALRLDDVPLPVRALVAGPPAAAAVVKALHEAVVTRRTSTSKLLTPEDVMKKAWIAAAALVALLPATALAQDAKTVIANASKAMGVDGLNSITFYGSGANFGLGQSNNANGEWPRTNLNDYVRAIDFAAVHVARDRR